MHFSQQEIQCYLTTPKDDPANRNRCIEETHLSPAHALGQDQEIDVVFALAADALRSFLARLMTALSHEVAECSVCVLQ